MNEYIVKMRERPASPIEYRVRTAKSLGELRNKLRRHLESDPYREIYAYRKKRNKRVARFSISHCKET